MLKSQNKTKGTSFYTKEAVRMKHTSFGETIVVGGSELVSLDVYFNVVEMKMRMFCFRDRPAYG